MKLWIYKLAGGVLSALTGLLWWTSRQRDKAREEAAQERTRADRAEAGQVFIEGVQQDVRKVEDAIRRDDLDARRSRLLDYAARDDDPR